MKTKQLLFLLIMLLSAESALACFDLQLEDNQGCLYGRYLITSRYYKSETFHLVRDNAEYLIFKDSRLYNNNHYILFYLEYDQVAPSIEFFGASLIFQDRIVQFPNISPTRNDTNYVPISQPNLRLSTDFFVDYPSDPTIIQQNNASAPCQSTLYNYCIDDNIGIEITQTEHNDNWLLSEIQRVDQDAFVFTDNIGSKIAGMVSFEPSGFYNSDALGTSGNRFYFTVLTTNKFSMKVTHYAIKQSASNLTFVKTIDVGTSAIVEFETDINEPLLVNLELPESQKSYTGISNIQGYMLSGSDILSTEIFIDDVQIATIRANDTRIDVAKEFSQYPNAIHSGFSMAFNYSKLSAGSHQMKIVANDALGNKQQIIREFNVNRFDSKFIANKEDVVLDELTHYEVIGDNEFIIYNLLVEDSRKNVHMKWSSGTQGFKIDYIE